ncbi:MAG TPA: hypothetical protein DEG71_04470 [Clostridiales bacterium]|nr:hypothetical protein [Clostridiales bacterium]
MRNQEQKEYYIFPNNYDDAGKFLGIIEYRTLILIAIWFAVSVAIYFVLPVSIHAKVYGFIFTFFPPAIFLIIGINGDSVIDFAKCFSKFMKNSKVHTFNKDESMKEV